MSEAARSALPSQAQAVLSFWFEELEPEQWWRPDPAIDEIVRGRFLALYEMISAGVPDSWRETAAGRLAAVIVLDQFPRNMFRGSPRAFATDAMALSLADETIAEGLHETLEGHEKSFLFMPLQHSENADAQARSVALFATLDDPEQLGFAEQHKEIIDRFGRFPHRNACLGRQSTAEEADFLKGPALFW